MTTLDALRAQVRAIEAAAPPAQVPAHRPLAFTLQFRGWRNATGMSDEVLARCIGLPVARLRRLYNHELPRPDETPALAIAMEWSADRLAALIEADRLARALRQEPA